MSVKKTTKAKTKAKAKPQNFGAKTVKENAEAKKNKTISKNIKRREVAAAVADARVNVHAWHDDAEAIKLRKAIDDVLSEAKTPDSMFASIGKRHAEILEIHASLSFARIQSSRQEHIATATLRSAHIRSQCVSVKLKAMRALDQGKALLDSGRGYLRETYRDVIKGGTQEERKAIVDSFFAVQMQIMNSMDNVIEFADTVINDCDAMAWAVKRVSDVMNKTTE
jgi:hypothetical protein